MEVIEKQSGIYKIQSKIHPERIYIGSAVNVQNRLWDHKVRLKAQCHKNPKLQSHYNKYGMDDLSFTKIEENFKELLIEREQYYLDTLKPWFNISLIAGNSLGRFCSDETKKKIGDANRGKKRTPEVIQKLREANLRTDRKGINNPMYGRKHTVKEIERIKNKLIGRKPWNTGTHGLIKSWCKGLTKETDDRIIKMGEWRNDQTKLDYAKETMSLCMKGRKLSAESIVKRTVTFKLNKSIKEQDYDKSNEHYRNSP